MASTDVLPASSASTWSLTTPDVGLLGSEGHWKVLIGTENWLLKPAQTPGAPMPAGGGRPDCDSGANTVLAEPGMVPRMAAEFLYTVLASKNGSMKKNVLPKFCGTGLVDGGNVPSPGGSRE